jgi:hypothetical protein
LLKCAPITGGAISFFQANKSVFRAGADQKNKKPIAGVQKANFNKIVMNLLEVLLKYHLDCVIPEMPRLLSILH